MTQISLTVHGSQRVGERLSVTDPAAQIRLVERAWNNGRSVECFEGRMRKYLERVLNSKDHGVILRVHSRFCYIFSLDRKLITVLDMEFQYEICYGTHSRRRPSYDEYDSRGEYLYCGYAV